MDTSPGLLRRPLAALAGHRQPEYLALLRPTRTAGCLQLIGERHRQRTIYAGCAGQPAAPGAWLRHLARPGHRARHTGRALLCSRGDGRLADPGPAGAAERVLAAARRPLVRTDRAGDYLRGRDGRALLHHPWNRERHKEYAAHLPEGCAHAGHTRPGAL